MRRTALALGLKHEIDQTQYVSYQLHQPLQEAPGTHFAYCNFCYDVLGMIVAKASGMSFIDYVQSAFMNHYAIGRYGLPPAKPELGMDYYAGEIPGTLSCAEQLPNGTNYVFITNQDQYPYEPGAFGLAQRDIQASLYPPASAFKGKGC